MNSEKLGNLALIAEIAGGLAVIITLIILVVEVQGNTSAIQRATYDDISKSISEWRGNQFFNPEIRTVILKLNDGEQLSKDEDAIYQAVGRNLYSIYERAFWANDGGQVGDSEWARIERMLCSSRNRFWFGSSAELYTDEFVEFVNTCR
ncbi:MAG: hypothetical protein DHS20C12_08190 [Pseudohongiella sp.]|nr:MAG: hypothetical protein DHS20C12_08190 [Pseudohongiella sp.]